MVKLTNLRQQGVDLAIRWGTGRWTDCRIEKLFLLSRLAKRKHHGTAGRSNAWALKKHFSNFTLLRDHEDSNSWSEWYRRAGLMPTQRSDTLIINPIQMYGFRPFWTVRAWRSMMIWSIRKSRTGNCSA